MFSNATPVKEKIDTRWESADVPAGSAGNCPQGFEEDILPHLSSAYNLARYLTRNDQDAEDIVQEAYLRAFRFYNRFQGGDTRPWLLKIVRNVFYTWWRQKSSRERTEREQEVIRRETEIMNPEETIAQRASAELLQKAIEALPARGREVLLLREIEGLSYQQISILVGVRPGTVMSRLGRARARLRKSMMDLTSLRR